MSPEMEVVTTPDGLAVAVTLDAFDGDTADERMANALKWSEAIDSPVIIDKGDAVITEMCVWGLGNVTITGTPL